MATGEQDMAAGAKPKQGLGRALRDIIIGAVVLGGLFAAYAWKVGNDKAVAELAKQAKEAAVKDTVKGYQKARGLLKEALGHALVDPFVPCLLGEVSTILATELDGADAQADADLYVQKCEDKDPQIQERYSATGLQLLAKGDAKAADALILDVLQKGAASGKLVDVLGRAQRAQGKWAEAKNAFKRAVDSDWRSPRYAADYGDFLLADHDLYNATNAYDKGLQQNPEHVRCLVGRARALIARGDRLSEANDALAEVVNRGDEVPSKQRSLAAIARGELLRLLGKDDDAAVLFDGALQLDPNNAGAHHDKGLLLAAKGEGDAALGELKKAVELDAYQPKFYFDAAIALMKVGKKDEAVAQMTAYEKALPKDERYYIKYGDLLREKGDLDSALAQYAEALKIDEINADAHYSKGVVHSLRKEWGDAETELGYAIAGRPNFPDALRAVGDMWWERKEIERALENYAQSLVKGKMMKQPKEKLDAQLAAIVEKVKKAGKKEYASAFEKEIKPLIQ